MSVYECVCAHARVIYFIWYSITSSIVRSASIRIKIHKNRYIILDNAEFLNKEVSE